MRNGITALFATSDRPEDASRRNPQLGVCAAACLILAFAVVAPQQVAATATDVDEPASTPPTIASVTISSTPSFDADGNNTADTYVRRDRIVVDVRFSEAVTVSGGNNAVRLRLDLGADDSNLANSRRVLKLKSVVGGDTLRFEHRVTASDSDPDGVWVQTVSATNAQTVFRVSGATVASTATGTAAVLTKSGLPTSGAATHKVDGSRTQAAANRAPSFPAAPPGTPSTVYVLEENNAAGTPVVTVAATDPDGDALTYALDSASDAVFDIDSSGNITVPAANALDHETQANYTITVSVHDGKDAAGAVDTTVDATRRVRIAVGDLEEPPVFPANAPTTLEVAENNAAGAPVGTVSATDSDGDALTYALDSASDAVFDIDSSGNITVPAANALDNETTASYSATVSVHDGKDAAGEPDTTVDATHSVTIRVTNVEELPAFPANAPTTLEVAENNAAGAPVGTVSATDPDGDALTYALDSASDAVFDIDSSGAITVTAANALDYETTASYTVTVSVHDGKDAAGQPNTAVDATHSLTIAVTDVEESTGGPPTIASVTIGSTPSFDADSDNTADTYVRRDKIVVDVRFSEAVTVSGGNNNVRLRLDLGADDSNLANSRRVLKLKSVVGGNTLRFEHRVTASDSDPDGVWVQTVSATNAKTVFTVHGATVTGTATGTAAVLTKSGLATSGAATHKVDGSRTQAPAAANGAPTFPATAPATFEVAENNAAGAPVGTVAATDPDGDALTYTLDSASDAVFDIDANGNITVTAADALDYETTASYAVTVSVHDGKDAAGAADTTVDATHSVTITVTEAPAVLAPAKPVVVFRTAAGGSLTSTAFEWRLPVQPAGVTVSAVEVQVMPRGLPPSKTVASLAPAADGELMGHTVIGLTPGKWYFVRIRLVTNSGNADSEDIVMVKMGLPNPVTDLSVSNVTRTSVDLSWTMPPITESSPSLRALNVQQRGANGSWSTLATITPDEQSQTSPPLTEDPHYSRPHRVATLYTVTGLTAGTSYTFRIRLVPNSSADSVDSETASTTTLGGSLNPAGGLTATNPTATTIDLGWALPTQPTGVTVTGLELQQQSGNSWTKVASLGADATSYTVTGLTEGTSYTFRVRLTANNGTVDSETVSATALAPPKPATTVAVSERTRIGIGLSWTLPAQGTGVTVSAVEVQYKLGAAWSTTWSTVATLASDATSHTVAQVTPGTNYAFRIRLATNNGHADSKSVKATAFVALKPATGFTFSNVTGTTVDLSWTIPAQPEGVVVTAVELHSGGLIKPGEENVPNFSLYGHVELAGDATSITLQVLHGGFTFNYRVRLITNSGEVDSQVASWSSTRPYPKRATDLTASNATQTTVDLAWTLPQQPGVTVSAVEVRWGADEEDDPWDNFRNKEALASDAASQTVTGLSAGTNYIFLVRLVTSSGNRNSDFLYATTPSGAVSAPGVSVADASANEGADAAVEFEVTLSQAASGTVTVDYATANIRFAASNGGAMAGEDYTAVSGTLTFVAGETVKTVSVPILDDAIDEGAETFTLQLRNAQGAWISDAEATGTITNSDPLQKMWLSRFGRTVAGHVVDAVSDRLSGPLTGAQVTLGGQTVDLTATEDEAWLGEAMTSVARALGAPAGPEPEGYGWTGSRAGGWGSSALAGSPARTMSGHELLLGSAFHLAQEGEAGGPGFAAWGRVAVGGFDGEAPADAGSVRIDGDVTTGVLGADAAWDRLLAGVAVSVSEGEGTFDQPGVDSGTVESTMKVVSPYGRVNLSERVSAWGLVGFGTGDMTIVQAANDRGQPERVTRTDLGMRLAAVGGRGVLLESDETGGMDLALKADAFMVETESEAVSNEGSTTADASRVRLALEGGRAFAFGGGATLRPSLEFGLRHDGGDAETGTGVELGGGVSYADPASGLSVEAKARMLVAHADSDYKEWGASASVRLAPGAHGRGLSFSLSPTLGATSSAAERLWGAHDARGLVPGGEFEAEQRLQGELGYGLAVFGDRFTGTPNLGFGLSDTARDYRIGWRLTPAVQGHSAFEVNLDATRRESVNDDAPPEHGAMLRGTMRW